MIGFYDLVKTRLEDRDRCPALLQVATAMDAAAAADMLAVGYDVTALVSPLSDRAMPINASTLRFTATEAHVFGVTMAMVYPAGFEQFEPAREQIKAALRGWQPAGLATAIKYDGGQLLQYRPVQDGGLWLHLLRFSFTTQDTYGVSL
jgi:hypothetical protein